MTTAGYYRDTCNERPKIGKKSQLCWNPSCTFHSKSNVKKLHTFVHSALRMMNSAPLQPGHGPETPMHTSATTRKSWYGWRMLLIPEKNHLATTPHRLEKCLCVSQKHLERGPWSMHHTLLLILFTTLGGIDYAGQLLPRLKGKKEDSRNDFRYNGQRRPYICS